MAISFHVIRIKKAPAKSVFFSLFFRLNHGSNMTLSILIMGKVGFVAAMPQNIKECFPIISFIFLCQVKSTCLCSVYACGHFGAMLYGISGNEF